MRKWVVSLFVTGAGLASAATLLSSAQCNGLGGTCSPSACTAATNSACSPSSSTIDVAASVSAIACNSACTQNTAHSWCSSSALASTLATSNTGLKAAYCTDTNLVIHSDGIPPHPDSLANIPVQSTALSTVTHYGCSPALRVLVCRGHRVRVVSTTRVPASPALWRGNSCRSRCL